MVPMPSIKLHYFWVNQSQPSGSVLVFPINVPIENISVPSSQWCSQSKPIGNALIAYVFIVIITYLFPVPNNIYILILQKYKRVASYKQGVCAAGHRALTVQPPNLAGLSLFRTLELCPKIHTKASANSHAFLGAVL